MEQLTTLETALKLGLREEEYEKTKQILGRTPNFTELSIFSVMWSEHCCYKNSIVWLKQLPKKSPRMLAEAGEENAGLVDIGGGLACSFKIESHNHPSALEPYQGAATGVGGINRDIFTMGARPIAQLNSLRFGNLTNEKAKWHLKGVVKGIGDYGNAFGIPTVGGEIYFDDCYAINPLVNAFSAGIAKVGHTASATSYGVGNPVFIVGSSTGKDGIHGAAFASKDLTEDSTKDLPAVQVGDPFMEKLLLEASLEVLESGAVIGIQDMGAAGIICSTSEMSAKGEHGMDIWLDKVPMRQANMKPFEILLSESQERMLVVVKKGMEDKILSIFDKWDLNCAQIGVVTDTKRLHFYFGVPKEHHNEMDELLKTGIQNSKFKIQNYVVADVPCHDLVLGGGAPVYHREYTEPPYFKEFQKFNIEDVKLPTNFSEIAKFLLGRPNIASKRWIARQYDSMVGTVNMITNAPSDSSVVKIKGTNKALAMNVDCNGRYVNANPEEGCAIAVSEAARNVVCSGGEPVAITNNLNFGNPYNPHVYWQFVGSIKGMKKACEKFQTPVTGGNVSFYNQYSTPEGETIPVFPTPTIGMLGILDDRKNHMTLDFKNEGDYIYLIGNSVNDIACSEYLYAYHKIKASPAPYFNLDEEYDLHQTIKKLIYSQLINACHDLSDGGLIVTLTESAMPRQLGFDVHTDELIRKDAFLFGEAQGRVVVTVTKDKVEAFTRFFEKMEVYYLFLGNVTAKGCIVDGETFYSITEAKEIYDNVIEKML
jgi:phosphoribosylformylglycinamidine (FGAM) synthase-like enzyme